MLKVTKFDNGSSKWKAVKNKFSPALAQDIGVF